ncbi:unnamed protein product [Leuciscus chuanchicus]
MDTEAKEDEWQLDDVELERVVTKAGCDRGNHHGGEKKVWIQEEGEQIREVVAVEEDPPVPEGHRKVQAQKDQSDGGPPVVKEAKDKAHKEKISLGSSPEWSIEEIQDLEGEPKGKKADSKTEGGVKGIGPKRDRAVALIPALSPRWQQEAAAPSEKEVVQSEPMEVVEQGEVPKAGTSKKKKEDPVEEEDDEVDEEKETWNVFRRHEITGDKFKLWSLAPEKEILILGDSNISCLPRIRLELELEESRQQLEQQRLQIERRRLELHEKGGVEKVAVKILRDTGSSESFILESVLPFSTESHTGSSLLIRGIGLNTLSVPLHKVDLTCELVHGVVDLGIRPILPVDGVSLILGNNLAGGRVWVNQSPSLVVTDSPSCTDGPDDSAQQYPKVFVACAVTRSGAQPRAEEKISDAESCFVLSDYPIVVSREELSTEQQNDETLKPQFEQCEFAGATVTNLGKVVGQGQVRPVREKVRAIDEYPVPVTKKELMSFLGLVGFYRCFCRNFSTVVAPLTDLLKAKALFVWSESCQNAFEAVKTLVTTTPVLMAPQLEKTFKIQVDASKEGAGAVLIQEDDADALRS